METEIERAALLPDGRVVVAGQFEYFDRSLRHRFAVLKADGTVDQSFDSGDLLTPPRGCDEFIGGLLAQPDGKISLPCEFNCSA